MLADLCHISSSTYLKADMQYADKKNVENEYNRYRRLKG